MDITLLFKTCVKTIKTKNRAFGQWTADNDKSKILLSRTPKKEFTLRSKEIIQHITKLHDFLLEHQHAYLNFSNCLPELPSMSDAERDKIDAGAKKIIKICSNLVAELEEEFVKTSKQLQAQVSEHEKIVISLIKDYLKHVCKVYSEQRAVRVQQTLESKRLIKIDSYSPKKKNLDQENHVLNEKESTVSMAELNPSTFFEEEKLSSEELQMFEFENNELYNELNNLTDEIKQIENKVVKITELQEIFTEKILQQDKDMNHIAAMVVGTTENVKDANDQIREAIQRNAGFRVWILFFLLVLSFSLLFLDWYND